MSGPAAQTSVADTTADGAFLRKDAVFRDKVSAEEGSLFKPEGGRYVLYVSLACPWANRTLAALRLKGLTDAVEVSVVHPVWARTRPDDESDTHTGWQFRSEGDPPVTNPAGCGSFPCDGCVADPVLHARFVRDIYESVGAPAGTRFSVPVLYDRQTSKIVSNESAEILRMFNSEFNNVASNPSLDLYPAHLRATIDGLNDWIYADINNGVYRCGFATSQKAYEEAFRALYAALDKVERILSNQRFMAGAQFTEADVRLFMTLIRFDEVYAVYFKTNGRLLREMPNILDYMRELYQMPAIGGCIDMAHIKRHYYASHPTLNAHAIVPVGVTKDYSLPHDRGRFGRF